MRRFDQHEGIAFSILDRVLYPDLPYTPEEGLRRLKTFVLRDLKWLLNTRQRVGGLSGGMDEVSRSLATYGLPDLSSLGVDAEVHRERVREAIEEAVRVFEPRLRDVRVEATESETPDGSLRFRIDATLVVSTSPTRVAFDTMLDLSSGEYRVKEG